MTTNNDKRMQIAVDGLAEAIRILSCGIIDQNIGAASKQAARAALDVLDSAAAHLERADIQDQVTQAVREAILREAKQGGSLWKRSHGERLSGSCVLSEKLSRQIDHELRCRQGADAKSAPPAAHAESGIEPTP